MVTRVLAVADGGNDTPRSAYSTAPTTSWTAGGNLPTFANGSGSSWAGVCFSKGLNKFFAVQANGSVNNNNLIAYSADGSSWTGVATSGIDNSGNSWTLRDICWSQELGRLVAVASAGPDTTKRILYSDDGDTWTAAVLPDASKALHGVAWSPDLSLFCAVGDGNAIYTSPNGVTWTARTGPATSKNWRKIAWAAGTIQKFCVIAGAGGGSNDYMYSSNGSAWTQQNLTGTAYDWQHIAYGAGTDSLAVVGGNTGVVAYSTNGTGFTQIDTGLGTTAFRGIAYSAALGSWVGVGNTQNVLTSANGTTWSMTSSMLPASQNWHKIAAGEEGDLNLVASFIDETVLTADITLIVTFNVSANFVDESALTADFTITVIILTEANFVDEAALSAILTATPPPPPIQSTIIIVGR